MSTSVNRELQGQIRGRQALILPPQKANISETLLEYAADQRVYVMDITGKVYNQALMPGKLPQEIVDALTITRKPRGCKTWNSTSCIAATGTRGATRP